MTHDVTAAIAILRAIGNPERLRVIAALTEGPLAPSEVAAATGVELRAVGKHLGHLESARLIVLESGKAVLEAHVFEQVADGLEAALPITASARAHDVERYFRNGRLPAVPVNPAGERAVAAAIAELVPPGVTLSEAEINDVMGQVGDPAVLRRLLVDHGHLEREASAHYRRTTP